MTQLGCTCVTWDLTATIACPLCFDQWWFSGMVSICCTEELSASRLLLCPESLASAYQCVGRTPQSVKQK